MSQEGCGLVSAWELLSILVEGFGHFPSKRPLPSVSSAQDKARTSEEIKPTSPQSFEQLLLDSGLWNNCLSAVTTPVLTPCCRWHRKKAGLVSEVHPGLFLASKPVYYSFILSL